MSRITRAETYPTRPVRIVVGFPAGGTADLGARLIGQFLSERLGQPFIIENRPGASTNLAAETVVRAPADGHTLLWCGSSSVLNATLYDKLNFIFIRDFAMVANVVRSPLILEVHPTVAVNNIPEFISYAKANPGKLSVASYGAGTVSHVAIELFKMQARIDVVHVPYRGSPAMVSDLVGGQVQVAMDNLPTSIEHIKARRLKPLAVTTAERSFSLPEVPTVNEFLPGFEVNVWNGVCVLRNTPVDIVAKLNKEINAGLADPKISGRYAELGGTVVGGSAADFSEYVVTETERWAKVIRAAKIKAE